MSTCNRMDLETLGSRLTMSKNFPGVDVHNLGSIGGIKWISFPDTYMELIIGTMTSR